MSALNCALPSGGRNYLRTRSSAASVRQSIPAYSGSSPAPAGLLRAASAPPCGCFGAACALLPAGTIIALFDRVLYRPPYRKNPNFFPIGNGFGFLVSIKILHAEPTPPVLPAAEPGASYVRKNNPLWAILLLKRLSDCIRQPGSGAVILELSL